MISSFAAISFFFFFEKLEAIMWDGLSLVNSTAETSVVLYRRPMPTQPMSKEREKQGNDRIIMHVHSNQIKSPPSVTGAAALLYM
jgi:hypothetical protein